MRTIKILVLFIAISSIQCWSDEMRKNLDKWENECLDETDVDKELARKAMETRQYPDDVGFKNFIFCLVKRAGTVDSQGNFIPSTFKQLIINEGFDESLAIEILEKCDSQTGEPVDKAFKKFVCYQELVPEEIKV